MIKTSHLSLIIGNTPRAELPQIFFHHISAKFTELIQHSTHSLLPPKNMTISNTFLTLLHSKCIRFRRTKLFSFFFSEVIEKLGNISISINNLQPNSFTNDNVVELLHRHEQFQHLYKHQIEHEIEYISSYFYELCEVFFNELKTLSIFYNLIYFFKIQFIRAF